MSPEITMMVLAPWVGIILLAVVSWWDGYYGYWHKDNLYPWMAEKASRRSRDNLVSWFLYVRPRRYFKYKYSKSLLHRKLWKRRLVPCLIYTSYVKVIIINDERVYINKNSSGKVFSRFKQCYYIYYDTYLKYLDRGSNNPFAKRMNSIL